jgi:fibronectin type 3 domain-containing protein
MPEVATHLLASFDGYTTKGRSKTVLDSECKDLEELVFGQPDDLEILHKLTTAPTAMVRRLQSSGRYALSRILPGQADSAGRQSICVCTLVLDVAQYVAIAKGDLWKLLNQPQLWQVANFSANKPLSIPTIAPETRAAGIKDVRLFDAWLKATSIQKGLAVPTSDEITDADIARLTQVLDESDVPRYLWGCRLFSPQVPVQIATFVKEGIARSGRRTVVSLTSQLQTQAGSVALSTAIGKSSLPPSIAKAIPVPTSAQDYDTPLEDMQAIGLDPESDTWSKPRTSVRRSSSGKPEAIKAKSSAVMWFWIAAAASILITTGIASFVIWKQLAPPQSTKNLQIVSDQSNQIRLKWEKAAENATYRVERSEIENPEHWKEIVANWPETTLDDTAGVILGQRYLYRITTLKNSSITSKEPSNTECGYLKLPKPVLEVSEGSVPKTFKIEWKNLDNLKIKISRSNNKNEKIDLTISDTQSSYIDIETEPGVNYSYTAVFSAKKDTEIKESEPFKKEISRKLESPTEFIASPCGQDITLSWKSSTNATKYQVFRRKKGEDTWAKLSPQPNEPKLIDTKIIDGQIYEYEVEAQADDNNFNSGKSPTIKGWRKPAVPTNFRVIAKENSNNVTLSWNYQKGLTYKIKRDNIEIINQPKDQETTATDTLPEPQVAAVQFIYTITAEFLDENGRPCTSETSTTTYSQPAKIIVAPPVTAPPPTTPPNNPDKPEDICGKLIIDGKKITISDESTLVSFKNIIPKIEGSASTSKKQGIVDTNYEKLITEVKDILTCLNQKQEIYFILNTQIRKDLRTELKLLTPETNQQASFWNGMDEKFKIKFKQKLDDLDASANTQLYEKILEPVSLINDSESILREALDKLNLMPIFPQNSASKWKKDQLASLIENLLQLCKSYNDNKNKLEIDYEQFRSNKTNKKFIELNKKIEVQEEELKVLIKNVSDKERDQEKINQGKLNLDQFKAEQKKLGELLKTLKPDIKQCLMSWLQQLIQYAGYKKSKGPIEIPNGIEIEIEKLEFVYEQLGISKDVPPETNSVDTGDR